MKYIKLFEEYSSKYKNYLQKKGVVINNNDDIFNYDASTYVKYLGCEGFNDEEDAIEYLNNFLNTDFPEGLRNIPNKVTLYRLLALEDIEKLDKDDFGTHYVSDKDIFDKNFIDTIGLEDVAGMIGVDYNNAKLYIITVEVDKNQLDLFLTLHNRLLYPTEYEFTTIRSPKIEIKNIELFEI